MLLGCCLVDAVAFGGGITTISLFMSSFITTLETPVTSVTLFFTLMMLGSIIPSILGPRILKKNVSVSVAVSGTIIGLMYIVLSKALSLPMIWVAGVVVGLVFPMATILMAPIVVTNWFFKRQGFFMGLVLACTGLGSAVLSPIFTALIAALGWQSALMILGILIAVVSIVCGALLIRYDPVPMGLLPYGADVQDVVGASAEADAGVKELPGIPSAGIFKLPAFWFIMAAMLFVGVATCINQQANTIVQMSGFAAATAGIVVSCQSMGNIVGKLLMGWVRDRTNGAIACLVGAIPMAVGFACYVVGVMMDADIVMIVGGVIEGIGCCLGTIAPPLYVLDAFGPREYGNIYGIVSVSGVIGNALGAVVVSGIFDVAGSYIPALVLLIIVSIVFVPLGFAGVRGGQRIWKPSARKE